MKKITLLFTVLIATLAIQISFAAPSLRIIKPQVTPVPSWTGPGIPMPPIAPSGDYHAELGQWFVDRATRVIFTNCTHELYDNVYPDRGGGYMSCTAIFGYVSAITYQESPGTPIMAFDIYATIHNDIPTLSPWLGGANSHNEVLLYNDMFQKMSGPLFDVKLTAEFSVDATLPYFPPTWTPLYTDRQPYIEAINHQHLAWYCWTDNPEAPQPAGNFHVPTWDLGNIAQGASKSVTMSFQIPAGLPPIGDARYHAITNSFHGQTDILLNRTASLKISEWIEDLRLDTCVAYPDIPVRSSNASVFHNVPEPGIITGISLIILRLYRRIKK